MPTTWAPMRAEFSMRHARFQDGLSLRKLMMVVMVCLSCVHLSHASEAPAPPAVDPDQYMVLEYLWSFPKPEDIRAGILRTLSRSHGGEPRVNVEGSVPALQSIEEIASAAYGEEEQREGGLVAKIKELAPPVLGVASAAALTVLAKGKVGDILSKSPGAEKVDVVQTKAAPPPPATEAPKTEAVTPKTDVETPKTEAADATKTSEAAGAGTAGSEAGGEKAAEGGAEEKESAATEAKEEEAKGAEEGTKEETEGGAKEGTKEEAKEGTEAGAGLAFVRMPVGAGGGLWSKWRRFGGMELKKAHSRCGLRPAASTSSVSAYKRTGGARFLSASGGNDENVQEPAGFEKFFAGLFGSIGAAPEQVGLARFDRSKFPELYPATLTEFAELLETDSPEMCIFRPLLAQTSLEQRELKMVFDANRDGWEAAAFHQAVNKLGPGVVLARTEGGAILGGYNPKGWVGYGEYRGSIAAFLYTYPDGDLSKPAIKLRKVGGSSLACVDDPESGPRFGADGFHVPLLDSRSTVADGTERLARCKLGPYYERRADGSNSIFAPGESVTGAVLTDLKVFVGVYGPDEEIPFNDALPIQLE